MVFSHRRSRGRLGADTHWPRTVRDGRRTCRYPTHSRRAGLVEVKYPPLRFSCGRRCKANTFLSLYIGSLRYGGITYRYSQGPFRAIMFMAPDNRMHLSKRTFDSIALQLLSNVLHSYFNRRCRHLPPLPRRAPLPFDVHSDTLDGKTIVWPFSDTIFLGCGGCDGERVGHRPDKHGCVIAPPIVAASLPVPRHSWHSGAQLPTTFPPAVSLSFVAKAELSSRALTEIFLPPRPIMLRLSR